MTTHHPAWRWPSSPAARAASVWPSLVPGPRAPRGAAGHRCRNAAQRRSRAERPRARARAADRRVPPGQVHAAMASVVERFGRIDALVNNAGVAVFKPMLETSRSTNGAACWRSISPARSCARRPGADHAARPGGGGAIVNIASISGLRASTLRVAYGTSKAALIHLTKQQAVELGTVRHPRQRASRRGRSTPRWPSRCTRPAIRADYHDRIPLGRYGTRDEIADAIVFLCSAAASYINGQVLAVDGGFDAAGVGLPTLRRDAMANRPCQQ